MHPILRTSLLLLGASLAIPSHATELDQAVQQLADTLTGKNEAKVVRVNGDKLYLNIGKGHGVLPGHKFEIVRLGKPIVVDDETLGYEEQTIATATVQRSTAKLTTATASDQTETPRAGDLAYQQRKDIARIVVAVPTYQGAITELGNEIQDKLINALVDRGISVVERSRLEEVLREQKLSYSGLVDLGSAKQVGKLLGADAIILGSIRDASNSVATNLRLVDLESGVALAGASVEVAKTPDIANGLKQRQRSRGATPTTSGEQYRVWENKIIKMTILSFTREGNKLIFRLKITNQKNDWLELSLSYAGTESYLMDNNNNQISFSESNLSKTIKWVGKASRIVTIVFDGTNATGDQFDWVSKYYYSQRSSGYFSSMIRGLEPQ